MFRCTSRCDQLLALRVLAGGGIGRRGHALRYGGAVIAHVQPSLGALDMLKACGRIQPFDKVLPLFGSKPRVTPIVEVRNHAKQHASLKRGLVLVSFVKVEDGHEPGRTVGTVAVNGAPDCLPSTVELPAIAGDQVRQHAAQHHVVAAAARRGFHPAGQARPGRVVTIAQRPELFDERGGDLQAGVRARRGGRCDRGKGEKSCCKRFHKMPSIRHARVLHCPPECAHHMAGLAAAISAGCSVARALPPGSRRQRPLSLRKHGSTTCKHPSRSR